MIKIQHTYLRRMRLYLLSAWTVNLIHSFNTQNHSFHVCRPLSNVWGIFLVGSPEANLSAFVKEDAEEFRATLP